MTLAKPPCRCTSIRKTTQGLWVPRTYLLVAGWWQWMEMVPCWVWELSSMRSPPEILHPSFDDLNHTRCRWCQCERLYTICHLESRGVGLSPVETESMVVFPPFFFWVSWCRPRVFLPGPQCRNGGNLAPSDLS